MLFRRSSSLRVPSSADCFPPIDQAQSFDFSDPVRLAFWGRWGENEELGLHFDFAFVFLVSILFVFCLRILRWTGDKIWWIVDDLEQSSQCVFISVFSAVKEKKRRPYREIGFLLLLLSYLVRRRWNKWIFHGICIWLC